MRVYRNCTTGAISENRSDFMGWYRQGDTVEVFQNGRSILKMIGTKEMGLI